MKEQGTLIKIDGTIASVRIEMNGSCGSCASKEACGKTDTSGGSAKHLVAAILPAGMSACPGDSVVMEIPSRVQALAIVWLLLLPLGLFAAGYIGARQLFPEASEGLQALGGLVGIGLGILLAALVSKTGSLAARPIIVSVHSNSAGKAVGEGSPTCSGCASPA